METKPAEMAYVDDVYCRIDWAEMSIIDDKDPGNNVQFESKEEMAEYLQNYSDYYDEPSPKQASHRVRKLCGNCTNSEMRTFKPNILEWQVGIKEENYDFCLLKNKPEEDTTTEEREECFILKKELTYESTDQG